MTVWHLTFSRNVCGLKLSKKNWKEKHHIINNILTNIIYIHKFK